MGTSANEQYIVGEKVIPLLLLFWSCMLFLFPG